jgi:diguanylate cyclase (GGDEF)-like protein/PAS domain S-box-containing protein
LIDLGALMQPTHPDLVNLLPDSVVVVNNKGEIIWVNNSITQLLGYQPKELIGETVEYLIPKRYREKHIPIRNSFISQPSERSMETAAGLWAVDKNKNEIPVSIELNHYEESGINYTVCSIRTLTEKELVVSALYKIQERLEFSQSLAHVGTWDWDIINETLVWTDEIYRIFGLTPQEFDATYEAFLNFIHPDDRQSVIDAVDAAVADDTSYDITHRVILPNGEVKHVQEKGRVIRDKNSKAIRMIGAVLDVTQQIKNENKLTQLAHFDELTLLPNRTLCRQEIETRITHALLNKKNFTILYIDLDNFKNINDTQGHLIGDDFLHEIAVLLSDNLPKNAYLARLGGDEFILISDLDVQSADTDKKNQLFCEKIIKTLQVRKTYTNCVVDITASIGVAFFPLHGKSFKELLSSADQAMYQAKDKGKNNYEVYNPKLEEKRIHQLRLISDMHMSLKNDDFQVYYQAKQNLKGNKLVGCEALVRWNHHELGKLSPIEFIPIAESSGLIIPLGKYVLEKACLFAKKWLLHSPLPITVSVNVSAAQLKSEFFVDDVKKSIKKAGIEGNQIELEITESLLMEDVETTIKTLLKLKKMGITISIDDFGTGYSSLSYLKKLPVDTLKIDKSFIDGLPEKEDDSIIVSSIVALADSLQLKTVAEGVENQEQKEFLSLLGCDTIQGYLYSKPIPENEFLLKFNSTNN